MKHVFASFFLGLFLMGSTSFVGTVWAQTNAFDALPSYEFVGNSSALHTEALNHISLENYRLRNTERVIEFEDGTVIKLKSAVALSATDEKITPSSYPTVERLNSSSEIIFNLFSNGKIGVTSRTDPKSKLAKIGKGFATRKIQVISTDDFDKLSKNKQEIIRSRPHQYRVE